MLSLMAVGNYIMTVDYKDSPGSTNNSDASNNMLRPERTYSIDVTLASRVLDRVLSRRELSI